LECGYLWRPDGIRSIRLYLDLGRCVHAKISGDLVGSETWRRRRRQRLESDWGQMQFTNTHLLLHRQRILASTGRSLGLRQQGCHGLLQAPQVHRQCVYRVIQRCALERIPERPPVGRDGREDQIASLATGVQRGPTSPITHRTFAVAVQSPMGRTKVRYSLTSSTGYRGPLISAESLFTRGPVLRGRTVIFFISHAGKLFE
jgi:hypothetical protein